MSLTALIEKLITEHGSSAILKERLGFLRDQISALEKENAALKSENAILKGEKNPIEPQPSKAGKEVKEPKKGSEKPRLDAVTEKVLKLFFDTGQELSVDQVAAKLSIHMSTVQYHFKLLSEAKLIVQTTLENKSSRTDESTAALFEVSYSGRKYLIENKIVT